MKRKTRLLILLSLLMVTVLFGATMTIEIPNADIPRMAEAYGSILGLGRPANQAEITEATRRWLINSTKDYERRKNVAVYVPPDMEMKPSPTPTATSTPTPTATPEEPSPTPTATP